MLLSKVNSFRPFLLWKTYSAWLVFCVCILIMTNGFASLTLVRAYRFSVLDVLVSYGLLMFWGILEAALLAVLMVLVQVILEFFFKKRFDLAFQTILITGLMATWLILFQAVLHFIL